MELMLKNVEELNWLCVILPVLEVVRFYIDDLTSIRRGNLILHEILDVQCQIKYLTTLESPGQKHAR